MDVILSALITGAVTLIGVMIANSKSNAVMEYKIEELTREVRKHNGFAEIYLPALLCLRLRN